MNPLHARTQSTQLDGVSTHNRSKLKIGGIADIAGQPKSKRSKHALPDDYLDDNLQKIQNEDISRNKRNHQKATSFQGNQKIIRQDFVHTPSSSVGYLAAEPESRRSHNVDRTMAPSALTDERAESKQSGNKV